MEKAEANKRNIYKNLIDQRKQKHEGFDQSKDITDSQANIRQNLSKSANYGTTRKGVTSDTWYGNDSLDDDEAVKV